METIFNVVIPVFGIILTGYLSGRLNLLGDDSGRAINRFVYYVALPVLLFNSMVRVPPEEIFNWNYIAAYTICWIVIFLLGVFCAKSLFKKTLAGQAIFGMGAVFGNTGYMGIPVVVLAFGEAATAPAVITVIIVTTITIVVSSAMIEWELSKEDGLQIFYDIARALLRNPLVISPVLGIAWSVMEVPVPVALENFCDILGAAAGPSALFALGLSLVGAEIRRGLAEVGVANFIKLIISPALMWILVTWVFELERLWAMVAVVMAALPNGAMVFVVASRYNTAVQEASAYIVFSTLLSVLTLAFVIINNAWIS